MIVVAVFEAMVRNSVASPTKMRTVAPERPPFAVGRLTPATVTVVGSTTEATVPCRMPVATGGV